MLLAHVRLETVADLDVVVAGQLDAALEAALDFLGVFLDAAQRLNRQVFGNDLAVANETNLAAALDVAVGDHAAGDVADARHLEDLPDLDVPVQLLADFRLEHS